MDIQEMQLDQIEQLIDTECADLKKDNSSGRDIAIVGISARASCAENIEEFWRSLCRGEDLIRDFPEKRRLDIEEYAGFLGREQERYAEKGYLENIDEFAPSFFHIFPYDAALIDPSQRLFLEEAWKSLEDAGLPGKWSRGRTQAFLSGIRRRRPVTGK